MKCQYAERTRAWPVAPRRYLPRAWADAPERRQQAHVPEAVVLQTKAERALARRDEAHRCGVRQAGVTGDAEYGDTPNFLTGLEERQDRHGVAVQAHCSVTLGRGTDSPQGGGPRKCGRRTRSGTGKRSRGAQGPQAGGGRSVSRGAAGEWLALAPATAAG